MIVANEMARTAALVRAREAARTVNRPGTSAPRRASSPASAEYVAIPSDSRNADPATMRRAADWIAGQLDFAAGRVEETGGHPVVRGEWLGAPGAPTVLVYGHYDVQPTGDEAEWLSPPFLLTVATATSPAAAASPTTRARSCWWSRCCRRRSRSAARLPLNVKFLIEGEEEIGSPHLPEYVRQHATRARLRPGDLGRRGAVAPGRAVALGRLQGAGRVHDHGRGRPRRPALRPLRRHRRQPRPGAVDDPGQPARPRRSGRRPRLLRRGDPAQPAAASGARRGAVRRRPVRGRARRPRDLRRSTGTRPCSACGSARPWRSTG